MELFETVAGLKSMRFRLLGVGLTIARSSPASPVLESVLEDCIEPAIRDLTAAAERLEDEDDLR